MGSLVIEVRHREASLVEETKSYTTCHECPDMIWLSSEFLYSAMVGCSCHFSSHSAFVGGSSNASPFGSSLDLGC